MLSKVSADRPAGVSLLRDTPVLPGQRWVYSAGFNVAADLASPGRIDVEIPDLERLLRLGARVAILSHQGNYHDGSAGSLEHVATYLQQRLHRRVGYEPAPVGPTARRRAESMSNGEAVLFGNTRSSAGEEKNDPVLAAEFAVLGDAVAVGGFSKAHREHASNVGILSYLPGVAAQSLLQETALLAPWAGLRDQDFSLAVLGGIKIEKISIGLTAAADTYDVIIPGGAVLNALLVARGFDVGTSSLGSDPAAAVATARHVLSRPRRAEICFPAQVLTVPTTGGPTRTVEIAEIAEGGCAGESIVDFVPSAVMLHRLERLRELRGRAFVAGPPGMYGKGHHRATDAILAELGDERVRVLLLGGDTVAELPWSGPASTGGGAALHYLAHGTCPVLEALAATAPVLEGRTS